MLTNLRPGTAVDVLLLIRARIDSVIVEVVTDSVARVCADPVTRVATDVGVEMLIDASVTVVTAGMTGFEFAVPDPLKDRLSFCWTAFACWPTAPLDSEYDLQALMPSYHV